MCDETCVGHYGCHEFGGTEWFLINIALHHETLWDAIGKVAAACKNHGIGWGAVVPDPRFCDRAIENGCRMPTMGNEVGVLRRGIEWFQSSFSNQFNTT